ncbi:FBD-associated F-box protein At3g52670-like [Rutidosis leptorrhynchoides]|uniref:FBD-associated F-box protein At3g52670-like n=1 Tax=Rutidosis leptorrhynchoides TaxID=125765 RepID=UPI003A98F67E
MMRMNTRRDRLSSLSDDLIVKILSYNNTKQAIRTSSLSSRWKNIWKSIPHLDLSTDDFTSLNRFHDFTSLFSSRNNDLHEVTRVLSSRNNEIELSSLKLGVRRWGYNQAFVKTVVDYAFSHNVKKMTIIWSDDMHNEIPNYLFMSHSLSDLTFIGDVPYLQQPEIRSSFDLPALTTLYLENVSLKNENPDECGGVFFKCLNLKNLILFKCYVGEPKRLIRHSEFSKLTIEKGLYSFANVVVPHLKNLTIVDCQGVYLYIYAPELSSLMFEVSYYQNFFANGLSCLEKVEFYMCPFEEDSYAVIETLQRFHNVKHLTLGLEIIEVASFVNGVSNLPSPFDKLTSLEIYPRRLERKENVKKVKIPKKVRNFLLGASPNATVSIYSRKEVKALNHATSAQRMLAKLQV